MAIITCPKCGGCGEVIQGDNMTSAGVYKTVCSSCNGRGYISDTPSIPTSVVVNVDNLKLERAVEDHYLKCPECGKAIKIQLGHYLVLPDTAKKI